jgi:hypothetical protein
LVKFTLIQNTTSSILATNLAIDLELSSIKSQLPWGDVAGKEIVVYLEDKNITQNSLFQTDSNSLGMVKRSN